MRPTIISQVLFGFLALNLPAAVNGFVPTSFQSQKTSNALDLRSTVVVINHGRPRNALFDKRSVRSPRAQKTTTTQISMNPLSAALGGVKALHGDTSYVLSAVLWLSAFGVSLERRTMLGKALSAPLATMALALITANIGLLPFQSPVCKSPS
jgi:hypothetical protein